MKNNSENKHTPGEWKVQPGNGIYTNEKWAKLICHTNATSNSKTPEERRIEADANAEHICKCVNSHDELVAALKSILTEINAEHEDHGGYYNVSIHRNEVEQLKSALQKAGIESLQKSSS